MEFPVVQRKALLTMVVLVLLAAGAGAVYFSLPPQGVVTVDGTYFTQSLENVNLPAPGATSTSVETHAYKGATFELRITDWGASTGGKLVGRVTNPAGAITNFELTAQPTSTAWVSWLTPDKSVGVLWAGNAAVGLLVKY